MILKSVHRSIAFAAWFGLAAFSFQLSTCLAQSTLSISCPSNIVISVCHVRGAVVTWRNPLCLSNGIPLAEPVICKPSSGSLFPVGTSVVRCEAFGSTNNRVRAIFTVTVLHDSDRPGAGLDTDGNGLNDTWEIAFKAKGLKPGDDTDGDGLTNEQEAIAGTDPFDPSFRGGVRVAVADIEQTIGGDGSVRPVGFTITTTPVWGKNYRFQVTPRLGEPWLDVARRSHSGYKINLADTNLPPWLSTQAFFRVIVSDVDEDGDGLTACEELILGTSDHAASTGPWKLGDVGALGDDWLSGGTGQDGTNSTAGGNGDDILIGGLTAFDQPCVGLGRLLIGSDAGIYGTNHVGAGLDILIANTGGDRQFALDWLVHLDRPLLREVALAHVGNGPGGAADPRFVVAAGTGGEFQLSSWSLAPGTLEPTRSTNREPGLAGWTVYLDVLEPSRPSGLTLNPFVVGRIGADSNLWLTLRRMGETGEQRELSTVHYGTDENFRVLDYGLAHQTMTNANGGEEQFLLVTPMIGFNATNQLELRVVVWSVSGVTGRITGIAVDPSDPSGNTIGQTNLPMKGSRLQIVRETDGRFVMSHLNRKSEVTFTYIVVNTGSVASDPPQPTFIVTFDRPIDPAPVVTPDFALGKLDSNHFTTLVPGTNCNAQLLLWKDSAVDCGPNCDSGPVLVTNRTINGHGTGALRSLPANNFALSRFSDSLALSAIVSGADTLQLNVWKVVVDPQPLPVSGTTNIITGLSPGAAPHVKVFNGSPPVLMGSEFDALTGRLEDGQLRLDRWRVAAKPGP